jgi:hypothetical protein
MTFLLLWVIFALMDPNMDPDSEYGSGSTDLIEFGSNPEPDPDPKPWLKVGYRLRACLRERSWLHVRLRTL